MRRSIRCIHGFCREVVACPECGDIDCDHAAELRNNGKRKSPSSRKPVVSKRVGPPVMGRRDRLMYATRERQAGR